MSGPSDDPIVRELLTGSARRVDPRNYVHAYTRFLLVLVVPVLVVKVRDLSALFAGEFGASSNFVAPWEVTMFFGSVMAAGATKRLFGAGTAFVAGALITMVLAAALSLGLMWAGDLRLAAALDAIAQKSVPVVLVVLTTSVLLFARVFRSLGSATVWLCWAFGALTYVYGAHLGAFPDLRLSGLRSALRARPMLWHLFADGFLAAAIAAIWHVRRHYGSTPSTDGAHFDTPGP